MTVIRPSHLVGTLACALLFLILAACAVSTPPTGQGKETESPTATPQGQVGEPQDRPGARLATVENVELVILESFPVQVHALVRGTLADGCTEIDQIETNRDLEARSFEVTITTSRDPTKTCTQALVPFEETVPLDVRNLPAGTYTVDVNGVQSSFELQVDNKPLEG